MAAPLLLRGLPLIRFRLHQQQSVAVGIFWSFRRQWLTAATGSKWLDDNVSSEDTSKPVLSAKDPPRFLRWDESEFRKWKNLEDEILRDIEPITALTKQILHSDRYADGECLTTEDEKAVAEKLLAYHPHSEDKIGCGLDCIMVDRHPQFRNSRCLFVIRTDGGWIDFSYQKCLRAYIRGLQLLIKTVPNQMAQNASLDFAGPCRDDSFVGCGTKCRVGLCTRYKPSRVDASFLCNARDLSALQARKKVHPLAFREKILAQWRGENVGEMTGAGSFLTRVLESAMNSGA